MHLIYIIPLIWAGALLTAILAAIPYLIWMWRTARNRNWRKLTKQVCIPVAAFFILYIVTAGLEEHQFSKDLQLTFDTKVSLGHATYSYESSRSFQGDGYSVWVYKLPESIKVRFSTFDKLLAEEFPKLPEYRSNWNSMAWRQTPFTPDHKQYIDFSLSTYDSRDEPALDKLFDEITDLLSQPGSFYAFLYKSHGDYPGNIDMFIIDMKSERLIVINHNT